jgi:hypothetical protein
MPQKITPDTTIKRNIEVFASEIDDEVVMMNIESGRYYGMDAVGSRIWELISEKIRVRDLIAALMKEYDVGEEQCRSDVMEFLHELSDQNLIEILG